MLCYTPLERKLNIEYESEVFSSKKQINQRLVKPQDSKPSISTGGNSVSEDHMIQILKTCIHDIQV